MLPTASPLLWSSRFVLFFLADSLENMHVFVVQVYFVQVGTGKSEFFADNPKSWINGSPVGNYMQITHMLFCICSD